MRIHFAGLTIADMTRSRRALMLLGLLLIVASLIWLTIAHWPTERLSERQVVPSEDLILPTPQALAPLRWCGT